MQQNKMQIVFVLPGVPMATDIVAQLADSLAKTGVEDGELSYKGQGRKLDDALSGECQLSLYANKPQNTLQSWL